MKFTPEQITRMAMEAGFQEPNPHDGYMGLAFDRRDETDTGGNLERFAAIAAEAAIKAAPDYKIGYADGAAAEREALEKIDWPTLLRNGGVLTWGDAEALSDRVIEAIRARGQS